MAHSLNNSARAAAVFYAANLGAALIAAAIILIPGVPLLSIALNANVLATVLLPVALVFMIMLANDRQLMGRWANGRAEQLGRDRDRGLHLRVRRGVRGRLVPADGACPVTPIADDDDEQLIEFLESDQLVKRAFPAGERRRAQPAGGCWRCGRCGCS